MLRSARLRARSASARRARVAAALWILWAIVVWNVVLDQTIVLAGRRYIIAAIETAGSMRGFVQMDGWIGPAAIRGAWAATLAAGAILLVGFTAIRLAARVSDSSSGTGA
jgi:hypothetical protein